MEFKFLEQWALNPPHKNDLFPSPKYLQRSHDKRLFSKFNMMPGTTQLGPIKTKTLYHQFISKNNPDFKICHQYDMRKK
jgi:hypothetical protein